MGDGERRSGIERRSGETREELLRRVAELSEADQRKNDFLAVLSHELRNPIHAIRTNAWLLAQRACDAESKEASAAIERQVALLSKLLEDLLNVISLARKTPLELATHDARELMRHAVDATRQSIEKRNHRLVVDLGPEPLPVRVDSGRVEQALMNILENAAKYTDPGGSITATARRVLGRAVLSIRDTGIGIAPEDLPTLFELYKQGSTARSRTAGGLGIGLHIASQMMKENGGSIEVQSAGVGLGSEFTITLPLHSEAALEEEEAEPEDLDGEEAVAHTLTILVVDDNRDAADSLAKLLRAWGHEVWTAYDGLQAIDVAREKRPLVALVDIALPKIDGYQVAQRLSRDQWGRTMTLVAVTGMGRDDDKERALAAGFDEHLTKPIDYEALRQILAPL
jgi:CheY-like chemotaxis protein